MQDNRNAGTDPAPRPASTPPPPGNVHGLGLVDALHIDVQPEQLPWLADEIDVLRCCLEDELAHQRARFDELPDAAKQPDRPGTREREQELDRRVYQLQVLAMIRAQLPVGGDASAAIANPWEDPSDGARSELERHDERVAVVGPAAIMTVLIGGAARNVIDALGEAIRGPGLGVEAHANTGSLRRGPELPRVTPTVLARLHAMAVAARAFTDTYLHALALQAYSFDPAYDPVYADELDVAARATAAPGAAGGDGAAGGNP